MPLLSPRTASSSFFSKIHTLTSLFVVLCVALSTFHRPTVTLLLELAWAVPGRLAEDDAGEDPAEVCKVYADSDDDLPNKLDATASIVCRRDEL
jgi:hypothetical protein